MASDAFVEDELCAFFSQQLGGPICDKSKSNNTPHIPPFQAPEALKLHDAPHITVQQPAEEHINAQTATVVCSTDNTRPSQQTKPTVVIPEAAILQQFGSSSETTNTAKRRKKPIKYCKQTKYSTNMARNGRRGHRAKRNHYKSKVHRKTSRHSKNNHRRMRRGRLIEYI